MFKKKTFAILAVVAMVLTMFPAQMFAATEDSTRLAGSDRISTALDVASAGWSTADVVILAPADQANLVDSLAAAPLAGQENAPILLTFKDSLASNVKSRIESLGAKKVYVIGAVSNSIVSQLQAISGLQVEKLAGSNRWSTADAINAKLTDVRGTIVVGYNAIADALSGGSYAAANAYQIVLAEQNGQVSSSKLKGNIIIIGGTGVVKDISGATRYGGADRYATNARVIQGLYSEDFERVYVANGASMVDALSASSLAAKYNAPVFLSNGTSVPAASNSDIKAKMTDDTMVVALGGTGAVSNAVVSNMGGSASSGGSGGSGSSGSSGSSSVNLSSIRTVEAVENTVDIQKSSQYLQVKVNGSVVTVDQLDEAGYDVEFQATEIVFDGDDFSSSGALDKSDLASLYDRGDREFDYMVTISQRSDIVGESDYATVQLIDGKVTASGAIASFQLNLVESDNSNDDYEAEKMTSYTMIEGETFEVVQVKAATSSSSDSDVTSGITLSSSDEWVVETEDDGNKLLRARSAGSSTITMKSGTVTRTFKITV